MQHSELTNLIQECHDIIATNDDPTRLGWRLADALLLVKKLTNTRTHPTIGIDFPTGRGAMLHTTNPSSTAVTKLHD